jgi:hypothetical protein
MAHRPGLLLSRVPGCPRSHLSGSLRHGCFQHRDEQAGPAAIRPAISGRSAGKAKLAVRSRPERLRRLVTLLVLATDLLKTQSRSVASFSANTALIVCIGGRAISTSSVSSPGIDLHGRAPGLRHRIRIQVHGHTSSTSAHRGSNDLPPSPRRPPCFGRNPGEFGLVRAFIELDARTRLSDHLFVQGRHNEALLLSSGAAAVAC